MQPDAPRIFAARIALAFRRLAMATGTVVLLAVVLLIVLNVAIRPYSFLSGKLHAKSRKMHEPGTDVAELSAVYPGKTDEEIAAIRHDTLESCPTGPTVVNPPPFTSRHVNIAPEGYRLIHGQMPFSTNSGHLNVFVFGGSTTWGYGLPDDETIASHLQRRLNDGLDPPLYHVFNYGVCASYSKFEKRHLERLIKEGRKPDHVIFIDGLNEFCRIPLNRPRESEPERMIMPPMLLRWIIGPVLFWRDQAFGGQRIKDAVVEYDNADLERACDELATNWRMIEGICEEYGIGCSLVLQPVSVYAYPLEDNLFLSEEDLRGEKDYYMASRNGYRMLLEEERLTNIDFLDLHRLRCPGHEYLDTCHYTSAFASEIARVLAERILSTRSEANPT